MAATVRPRRFLLIWVITGILVAPIGIASAYIFVEATYPILQWLARHSPDSFFDQFGDLYSVAVMTFAGLAMGAYIGLAQKQLVRRFLGIELIRWRLHSLLGSLFGSLLVFWVLVGQAPAALIAELGVPYALRFPLELSICGLLYMACLSGWQTAALRHTIIPAWRWLYAHLLAGLLPILLQVLWLIAFHEGTMKDVIVMVGIPLAAALITGITMFRLLSPTKRRGKEKRDGGSLELAPIFQMPPTKASVWDDAI